MQGIRAIAAAIAAVLVAGSGVRSLSAQPVANEGKPESKHVLSPALPPPELVNATIAEAIKSSIGRRAGDPNFDVQADLNGDGIVNALDMAIFQLGRFGKTPVATASPSGPRQPSDFEASTVAVTGERIVVESQTMIALPGQTVSVLILILDNATPLMGYTVEALAVPQSGAVGTVTGNVALTDFFDQRNLITAGGAVRDPLFSFIENNGTGGVTVSTITEDALTVLGADGVNDVLAQVFFDVPPDALGDFAVALGSASVLVDGNVAAVPFTFTPGTIRVLDPSEVPAVGEWGMIALSLSVLTAGTVVFVKRRGIAGSKAEQC